MSIKLTIIMAVAVLLLSFAPLPLHAEGKDDKEVTEKLDRMRLRFEELKAEVRYLEEQARGLQDLIGRTSGNQTTLIMQMHENVSAIGRAQSAVSTNSDDAVARLSAVGSQLTAANEGIERLSVQFDVLQKLVAEIPNRTVLTQVAPGQPEQLFAVAYVDYARGNYSLALSEFWQYVESYRDSDLADNAQYWIGEIYYQAGRFPGALEAFARVAAMNPKGDKATAALYRRAQTYEAMGQHDAAVRQLQALIKAYPNSQEAGLARSQLQAR